MNRKNIFTRFYLSYHIYILHHHYKPKDPFHNQDKCTKYIQLSFPNFESYNYVIVNGKPEIETLVINTAMSVEFYILWQRTYIVYLYSDFWTVGYCDITFTDCESFIVFSIDCRVSAYENLYAEYSISSNYNYYQPIAFYFINLGHSTFNI